MFSIFYIQRCEAAPGRRRSQHVDETPPHFRGMLSEFNRLNINEGIEESGSMTEHTSTTPYTETSKHAEHFSSHPSSLLETPQTKMEQHSSTVKVPSHRTSSASNLASVSDTTQSNSPTSSMARTPPRQLDPPIPKVIPVTKRKHDKEFEKTLSSTTSSPTFHEAPGKTIFSPPHFESEKSIPFNLPKRLLLKVSIASLRKSTHALTTAIDSNRIGTSISSLDSSPIIAPSPSSSVFHSSKSSHSAQNSPIFSETTGLYQIYRDILKEHSELYPNDTEEQKTMKQFKRYLDLFKCDNDPFAVRFEGFPNLKTPFNALMEKCETKIFQFSADQRFYLENIGDYIVDYYNGINEIKDVVDQKTYIELNYSLQSALEILFAKFQTENQCLSSKQIEKLKKCLDKVIPKLQPLYKELENLSKPLKNTFQKTVEVADSINQQLTSISIIILNENSLNYLESNLETVGNDLKKLSDIMKNEISPVVKLYETELNTILNDNDDAATEILDIIKYNL